ncbi:MAG: hypothetical protein HQ575_07445 [Candidatus Omnitrophica bacterium]|nr:hypothetical protein [Candidatus Omnitrophota bacterium]
MITRILGIIWIILGILWVVKPQLLRDRLKKRMARKMKWMVLGFVILLGFSILGSVLKAQGLALKLVGILGFIFVARAILFVTTKTSDKMSGWWQGRDLKFFRIWGAFILVMGAAIFFS